MEGRGRCRFADDGLKQYGDKLREEMDWRRLSFTPVEWQR
jgi:hypothetical protein